MNTNSRTQKTLVFYFSLFAFCSLPDCTPNENSLEGGDFEKELIFFE